MLDEVQAIAATLWTAHAHAIDAAYATPYLFVTSAEEECGKTRLLEVLQDLVPTPLPTMNISDAALFRAIDAKKPTLFLDEVDAFFNAQTAKTGASADKRALLNAGYRRGQVVYRMGGGNHTELQKFEVFGAKALAGLGTLPPTLASRCLRIELRRRRDDEPVTDFFPQDVAEEVGRLREQLGQWAEAVLAELSASRPDRVEGLRDRQNEVWRPLLAIAKLAGNPWLARARSAAVELAAGGASSEPSLGLLLLADIRTVFEQHDSERIATKDLIRALAGIEESPWGERWIDAKSEEPNRSGPTRLAKLLVPYRIRPSVVRVGDATARRYRREDFTDTWERFLPRPRPDVTGVTPVTHEAQSQADVTGVTGVTGVTPGRERDAPDVDEDERLAELARRAQEDEP